MERFNLALDQIARNIMDPNTDPEKQSQPYKTELLKLYTGLVL